MKDLKDSGVETVVTGDGADELLGGYSFMWTTVDENEWKAKRDKQAYSMSFSTSTLAAHYGLKVYSPFMDPKFIDWAVNNTNRSDCISELSMELSPTEPSKRLLHQTGKVCLRLAFPDSPSAYRRKDPIEVGSGCSQAHLAEYFSNTMSPQEFQKQKDKIFESDQVTIKDIEHLYYYSIFQELIAQGYFKNHTRFTNDYCCIGCGYQLKSSDATFCYICGAYPAQRINT